MSVLDEGPLVAKCYEVKSLIAVYRKCVEPSGRDDAGSRLALREMRLVKEQILNRILEMKKIVRRLELEVKPSF